MQPMSMDELEAAGYGYTGTGKICSCGTQISALKDSRLVPHHAVCDRVKEFRAADAKLRARTDAAKPKQLDMFGGKE